MRYLIFFTFIFLAGCTIEHNYQNTLQTNNSIKENNQFNSEIILKNMKHNSSKKEVLEIRKEEDIIKEEELKEKNKAFLELNNTIKNINNNLNNTIINNNNNINIYTINTSSKNEN